MIVLNIGVFLLVVAVTFAVGFFVGKSRNKKH